MRSEENILRINAHVLRGGGQSTECNINSGKLDAK